MEDPTAIGHEPATYERDVYGWANEQAALLRGGQLARADIENIAEEIESLGRSEKSELVNRLSVLLAHLLKWRFQPGLRSTSWELSIEEQRRRIAIHMRGNPSLRSSLLEITDDAYSIALLQAQRQTKLKSTTFPPRCPYDFAQVINEEFWPK